MFQKCVVENISVKNKTSRETEKTERNKMNEMFVNPSYLCWSETEMFIIKCSGFVANGAEEEFLFHHCCL